MNMKDIAQELILQYYQQLQELNYVISLRPQGERYPTTKEAGIMHRLMGCIKALRKEIALTEEVESVEQTQVATTSVSSNTSPGKEVSVFAIPPANKKASRISKTTRKHSYAPHVRS